MARSLRWIGLAAALTALSCTHPPAAPPLDNKIGGFRVVMTQTPPGLRIESSDGRVLLETYDGAGAPYSAFGSTVGNPRYEEEFGAFRITDTPQAWTGGDALAVTETTNSEVRFTVTSKGATLLSGIVHSTIDGTLTLQLTGAEDHDRTSLAFKCAAEDHFLGFGAQTDALDHRGHTVPIWVAEQGIGKSSSDESPDLWQLEGARHSSYWPLPYYVSSRGYGLLLRDNHRSLFELCSKDPAGARIEAWNHAMIIDLFDGPSVAEVVKRATGALGRQPAATALELSPWNDAIRGSAEVRRVAKVLRDNDIPSGALWTEDFRGGASTPGSTAYRLIEEWDTDRTLYPDAEAVASELHAQGFAWLAYFNTFLVSGTRVYQAATEAGVFVQNGHAKNDLFEGPTFADTGLLDLESEKGREFMKGYMRKALDIGFDGWMADFGEWQSMNAILPSGDPAAAHNLYPVKWQQLNREVMAERHDGRLLTFFVRSGFIGTPDLIPAAWAGDQRTDFQADDGLPTVLPLGIGLGLAGVSTFGSDIGGYQSATNPPSTKELFFRWTEVGALSPLMRTHHGTNPADEWSFEKDAETLAHYKRYAKLHIQLYPYFDALSHEAAATGTPIMRALPFLAPGAPEAWTSDDEYLLGPSVLIAPVVTAGATSRPVFLPTGQWIPLLGGAPVAGGATVQVPAPVDEVPAFALAGTVLPLLPAKVQTLLTADAPVVTLAQVAQERELWIYLGASGAFTETDGAVTTLTHAAAGTPDAFSSNGAMLPTCASATDDGPCVRIDAAQRTATVRQFHSPLLVQGGGATLATVTVAGTRTRTDAVVRW